MLSLVRCLGTNRLIGAEHLSEKELRHIRDVIDNAARCHDRGLSG